jgi:uncharacterized protein (DUF58 family)
LKRDGRGNAPSQGTGTLLAHTPRLARQGGLELTARQVLEGLYAGRHRSAAHGSSIDFAEHRPYQPGDELRTIDWRAYARTDRLLIRRFHDDRQLPLALIVDSSASMAYGKPPKRDTAILAAAALGLLAIDQGDSVRLLDGPTGSWSSHLGGAMGASRLTQMLGDTRPTGACDLAGMLRSAVDLLTRRSLVVMVSDLLCEVDPLIAPAADLATRGHELAVIQVLDQTEVALPEEWGRVTMIDPEGREEPFSCDTAAARSAYDQAMAAHVAGCRDAFAAARADHLLLLSDQPVAQALGAWLERRRRR